MSRPFQRNRGFGRNVGTSRGGGVGNVNHGNSYQKNTGTRENGKNFLFVANLTDDVNEEQISSVFGKYSISRLSLKKEVGKRPYCFVYFNDHTDMEEAFTKINGITFMGKKLMVSLPIDKSARTSKNEVSCEPSFPKRQWSQDKNPVMGTSATSKSHSFVELPPLERLSLDDKPPPLVKGQFHSGEKPVILCVANFPYRTQEFQIRQLFEDFNPIEVVMGLNQRTDNSADFTHAYVSVLNEDCAFNAIMELDNTYFNGRLIAVMQLDDIEIDEIKESGGVMDNIGDPRFKTSPPTSV